MNARKLFASLLTLLLLGASYAEARPPVGTAKARGVFNEFSAPRSGRSMAGSRRVYRSYAPARRTAPMIVAAPPAVSAPAPVVAQAPAETRRFSYAPAPTADAAAPAPASPCVPKTVAPTAGRRYSYAPAETSVAPAPTYAPRAYSSRPSYSGRSRGGSTNPNFPLLKTDPRKYNTR